MRRWIRLAVGLYPPNWRDRYGAEFGALLDDVGPSWWDFWDVLRGALAMQMKVLWSFRNVAAACGLAGAILAAIVAFQMDNRYVSSTILRVNVPVGAKADDSRVDEQLRQLLEELLSRRSLTAVIQSKDLDLYKQERQRLPLEDIVQSMKTRDIHIMRFQSAGGGLTNAFQIQFKYADPAMAQAVTRDLAARMMKLNIAKGALPDRSFTEMEILDPANLPDRPVSPNRLLIAAFGLIGGLALGAIVMGVRRWPMVAATGIGVAILAAAVSFLIPDRYVSSMVVRVTPLGSVDDLIQKAHGRQVLWDIIRKPDLDLYSRERARHPDDEVIETMRHDLQIHQIRQAGSSQGNGGAVEVRFTYPDPRLARLTVRYLWSALLAEQALHHAQMPAQVRYDVLDPPYLPERPVSPNRLLIAVMGLGAGLPLGVLAMWLRNRRTPALKPA